MRPFDNNADLTCAYLEIAEKLYKIPTRGKISIVYPQQSNRKESGMNLVEEILIKLLQALVTDGRIEDAKAHLVEFLTTLAAKTPTELDDYAVSLLEKVLGMKE